MKLARVLLPNEQVHVAIVDEDVIRVLDFTQVENIRSLTDVLHSPDPSGLARYLIHQQLEPLPVNEVQFLVPIDRQEVWAAGVTYKRSQQARMEESEHGASHYDRVYSADRPELFFKGTASRIVPQGEPVRVRADSSWSVPEPELALLLSPEMKIVGYTVGNDMSARDIEGENPLYLPQAKVYNQSCALGPVIRLAKTELPLSTEIRLEIRRSGEVVFAAATNVNQLNRKLTDLAIWLGKELDFPAGAVLLTGTGIIPPDDFTLEDGDAVAIEIDEIGRLENPVVKNKM